MKTKQTLERFKQEAERLGGRLTTIGQHLLVQGDQADKNVGCHLITDVGGVGNHIVLTDQTETLTSETLPDCVRVSVVKDCP